MKLLMHICCANCAFYPLQYLKNRGVEISGLWFNPNIHPFKEYEARMLSVRALGEKMGIDILFVDTYGLTDFIRNTIDKDKNRCEYCYSVRFEMTAQKAKEKGFDGFISSLLVSPYQNRDMIIQICKSISSNYGLLFCEEDFRPFYYHSKKMAKEMGFYQQKYCGCIYSEMERYGRS